MSNTTPWKHNTLDAIEAAEYALEAAREAVQQAHEALSEAHDIHRASEAVWDLPWEDALEELNDEFGSYTLAEAILRNDRDGDPEVAGVDVSALTPDVVYQLRELVKLVPASAAITVAQAVAQAADPRAEVEAQTAAEHARYEATVGY